jgi:hypothetical protein
MHQHRVHARLGQAGPRVHSLAHAVLSVPVLHTAPLWLCAACSDGCDQPAGHTSQELTCNMSQALLNTGEHRCMGCML